MELVYELSDALASTLAASVISGLFVQHVSQAVQVLERALENVVNVFLILNHAVVCVGFLVGVKHVLQSLPIGVFLN